MRTAHRTSRRLWRAVAGVAAALSLMTGAAHAGEESIVTVEAESGVLLGGARVSADGSCVENLTREGDGVAVTLEAPAEGFYDVVIRLCSVDGGHKENHVEIDGMRAGLVKAEGRAYQDAVLERVYLEKGAHEVRVVGYWCWIRVDRVSLRPSAALPEDWYSVEPVLVTPGASENARRLMTYLCDCYGRVMLSGQYCDDGPFGIENACIWKATGGEYPAVLGLDFIDDSPSRAAHTRSRATEYALEYWEQGGIVTFCWHWNAPEKYLLGEWWDGFYTEKVSIDLAAILDGRDREGYDLLLRDMDAIAAQLTVLRDAGVPVLWRPLHEASGGWFWWGAAGPEAYKQLYITLYDRLVNVHGLNNLIWVWNGQATDWYPGDAYVDIIGEDIYPGERVYASQAARFLEASRYTQERKLIVLSENGCIPDPELCLRDGAMWGFFCTWQGEFVARSERFNDLSEQYTEKSMVQKAYASDLVISRSELPDLKSYPLREE